MSNFIKPWIVLEDTDVSPSHWFPIRKQKAKLPNELIIDDYYFSPLGNVVQVLPITPNNEIVLVRQYKHGLGEILIEVPGGMQQANKTLTQSAIAELEEECGIRANEQELVPLTTMAINPTKLHQVTYGYILFDAKFNSIPKPDATEQIELFIVPASEALKMVDNGEIWVTDSMNLILIAARKYPAIFL
ncbi:NUDIX hydrolase [Mucilaginibacter endophyticus]|uniref:NUDIX hydrolase n=1 Tax=Mucilaginibacter endophyticus TaxID=2675003 RepID=UPI000E0CFD7F|nr:NUDIX hydrolase [Mucilaginibacter endophyticus]